MYVLIRQVYVTIRCAEGTSLRTAEECCLAAASSRVKDGFLIPAALIPAVVMAIVAIVALSPGQVLEETWEGPQEVICAGLDSLTMSINAATLQSIGELTRSTSSKDGECIVTMTLYDTSDYDKPADSSMTCTVTMVPIRNDYAFDVDTIDSGDCSTVGIQIQIDYGDLPGDWAPYPAAGVTGAAPVTGDPADKKRIRNEVGCHPYSW